MAAWYPPHSRGQVITFSRKLVISFTNRKHPIKWSHVSRSGGESAVLVVQRQNKKYSNGFPNQPSNGMSSIQIAAQAPAIGHAKKSNRANQSLRSSSEVNL